MNPVVAKLSAFAQVLPDRLRVAELNLTAAERALAVLLTREAAGIAEDSSAVVEARQAASKARQECEDLRAIETHLPGTIEQERANSGISRRHTVSVAQRKATKSAYLEAVDALSKRSFRGLHRDQVKQLGRELLEVARRAHRVPACKEVLADLSHKPGGEVLGELV